MKKLKWYSLGTVVGLILIYCGLCAIGPKNFDVERSETIDAPANMLYNMVNNLKSWESWSPWMEKDPEMKTEYGEKIEGPGAFYSWSGNEDVGAGTMTIKDSKQGEYVNASMLYEGFDDPSDIQFTFTSKNKNKTEVSWKHISNSTLPFLIRGIFLVNGSVRQLKKDFKNGLNKMSDIAKIRVEDQVYNGYKINMIDSDDKHFVLNRQEVPYANIQQFYSSNLGALFGKVQQADVEMDGMPCGLFFKFDQLNQKSDMAAAIPVKKAVALDGAQSLTIPEGKALQVEYLGDYQGTQVAHDALADYMKDYGILYDPPFIEEYVTDPSEEPDPKKWLTRITYFYKE